MRNAYVIVIMGDDMDKLSNQTFFLEVFPGSTHDATLNSFCIEHGIVYPFVDFYFSCSAVKLAGLGNVVLMLGNSCHIIALPDKITRYQFIELGKQKELFLNEDAIVSIMNIENREGKNVYEGIGSGTAHEKYNELVRSKLERGFVKKKEKEI